MKKNLIYAVTLIAATALFAACSKKSSTTPAPTTYKSGQGVISGTGGAVFSTSGTHATFQKIGDTIKISALIDTTVTGKYCILAFQSPAVGTFNFGDLADHYTDPAYQYTSVGEYYYYVNGTSGSMILHGYGSKTGTYTIKSVSATAIDGTYTMTVNDINSNGDAPLTISGSFTGNF